MNNDLVSPILPADRASRKGSKIAPEERAAAEYLASITDADERGRARRRIASLMSGKLSAEETGAELQAELRAKARPLELDFSSEPEPPDYIVDGMFERETVNLVS